MIRAAFAAQGLAMPRAADTASSTYTLASLAAQGSFLIIHPETMLRVPTEHPLLTALPVVLADATNPVGLLRLKDRAPSPVATLFAQEVQGLAAAQMTEANPINVKAGRSYEGGAPSQSSSSMKPSPVRRNSNHAFPRAAHALCNGG